MALIARRRRVNRTEVLGAVAVIGTVAAIALEYAHVWRHGRARTPTEADRVDDLLAASAEAALETVEVAVEGYRAGSIRENALLNLLISFTVTFGAARALTHTIRRHGTLGPLRNVRVDGRHIHHFVPGIILAFLAGAASILRRDERMDPLLAIPFGIGTALTLDEAALLLELDDVYWTEEGLLSVQVAFGAVSLLATGAVALRVVRRGERRVLGEPVGSDS